VRPARRRGAVASRQRPIGVRQAFGRDVCELAE
jgi:hypothetical protein